MQRRLNDFTRWGFDRRGWRETTRTQYAHTVRAAYQGGVTDTSTYEGGGRVVGDAHADAAGAQPGPQRARRLVRPTSSTPTWRTRRWLWFAFDFAAEVAPVNHPRLGGLWGPSQGGSDDVSARSTQGPAA